MAETLLNLIKNIIKENRDFLLEDSFKQKKLKLINNQLNTEFKKGINQELFLPYFKFYLKDKILFDLDDFNYIVINVGLKFLKSILIKLLYIDNNSNIVIDIDHIDPEFKYIFENYYITYDVIIFFEISDGESRLTIMEKDASKKIRKSCKIYNDFPFYNMKVSELDC